jgi:hypothetical protein
MHRHPGLPRRLIRSSSMAGVASRARQALGTFFSFPRVATLRPWHSAKLWQTLPEVSGTYPLLSLRQRVDAWAFKDWRRASSHLKNLPKRCMKENALADNFLGDSAGWLAKAAPQDTAERSWRGSVASFWGLLLTEGYCWRLSSIEAFFSRERLS